MAVGATRIERILAALGIEGERRGPRIWALCPDHDDSKPSWMVWADGPKAGLHHCFACDYGGNLVDLVVQVRGYATREAATDWLERFPPDAAPPASAVRLEVPTVGRRAFRLPREVIIAPLEEWVTPARDYALERGLTPAQVARWRLGYAVDGKLAGRVVIPTCGVDGVPRSYAARTFADAMRRYLYPSERESPDLDAMFGEQHWADAARVYVFEGALDALAAERVLERGSVAALGGSHIRPVHVLKISRFDEVRIVTDADLAGDRAAAELEASLSRHTRVSRVRLPEGTDANSLPPSELQRCLSTGTSPRRR